MKHIHSSHLWWLAAPALVFILMFWCQLHGRALGAELVGFDVSAPWALKSALGWVLAGCLLAYAGERLLQSAAGIRHPLGVRMGLALAMPVITMGNEVLLLAGDSPLGLWLYDRLPLHLTFGALLFAGYLWLRARQPTKFATSKPHAREALPIVADAPTAGDVMVEVMTGTGRTQVALADIECLEADRNYINVHTPQRSYLLRQTLSSLEKSLCPQEFLRVHRSIIVNRHKIRERRGGGVLVLSSGRLVRVSRNFARQRN
jgi:hypothetical protein